MLIEHRLLVVMAVQAVADHLIADLVDRQHQAKETTAVVELLETEKQVVAAAVMVWQCGCDCSVCEHAGCRVRGGEG